MFRTSSLPPLFHRSLNLTELEPAPLDSLRNSMYSTEQLEEHVRRLAQSDQVSPRVPARRLSSHLRTSEHALQVAHRVFTAQAQRRLPIPPSAEWLLDNFTVVREQILEIRQDLTSGFYAELPKLSIGRYAGFPRVYSLAHEIIDHTDNRFDVELLSRVVRAYQSVVPLTIGELWAIPIMLRLGLIENLARALNQSLARFAARQRADDWAERLLNASKASPHELEHTLHSLERSVRDQDSFVTFDPEFAVELMQRLRDQEPYVAPAIQWLEDAMSQRNASLEQYLRELNQRRAITRVSVGNAITSLRRVSQTDWKTFIEAQSGVQRILERDPAGVFPQMDFATRDRYRHVIERLSKRSRHTEFEVAEQAIALAARPDVANTRRAHVGYYLIDRGVRELQQLIGFQPTLYEWSSTWIFEHATLFYLGLTAILTIAFVLAALLYASLFNPTPAQSILVALLTLLPASVVALGIVNWTITVEVPPYPPPQLEFKHGIPDECRTLVVVPSLLSSVSGVEYLLEHLEQRYLTNRDANLYFALLSDFGDAPTQTRPEDAALLDTAIQGIHALNEKYKDSLPNRFLLLHRERRWNPVAKVWMGWERKRGKLLELNRLLQGQTDHSYTTLIGDTSVLPTIKYVITLDADTELPWDTARRLVGAIAHPLNHAVLDPQTRRVVEGYGIIQPRVEVTASAAAQTRFARIMTGDSGLDPYSSAVSDVYQDLFRTSVYIGKAIYEVETVRNALVGRFPENLLLSHDLLEGAYARVGLASDIVLLEDYPTGLDAYMQRQNRWTRGDWQIAEWLLPSVPTKLGKRVPNDLPLIERWKIFDNLRRSLVPPAIILLLLAGWTILPGSAWVWTLLALVALFFPLERSVLASLGVHPKGEPWRDYFVVIAYEFYQAFQRAFLLISFYLFQALQNLRAIGRTIIHRTVRPQYRLEWVSAADVERGQARTLPQYARRMWSTLLVSVLLGGIVALVNPSALLIAAPLLLLWFASPIVAAWTAQPLYVEQKALPQDTQAELRALAEKIWYFFERFAGEDDNWLPPDNYQVEPRPVIAHRTSPTNIGFLLMATIAAYDFDFLNADELLFRLDRILSTLEQMERYRGHWFNWYDTLSLRVLHPRYVSSVDSGNLAAALVIVKQACLECATDDPARAARWKSISECAANLLREMDFTFLYDPSRELFAIGYNLETNQRDPNYYDLFGSEARLTSYIAIALGQAPERHWFRLGRPLTRVNNRPALLCWGGSLFEYLMPTLFLPDYPHTLLDDTYHAVIARHMQYGRAHRTPWGFAEAGYYAFDFQFNYQYKMFGVPDLSLRREIAQELVVAPYATFLAMRYVPQKALDNLQLFRRLGAMDEFGFYESLDYTPERRPKGSPFGIVREFMAHHQGMSLVALDNLLNGDPMRRRFTNEPIMAAVQVLLQERVPQHMPVVQLPSEEQRLPRIVPVSIAAPDTRVYTTPHTPAPRTQFLSNGEYTVAVTNAGGGFSQCQDICITRWREDATRDNWGSFIYLQDLSRQRLWSATYQPTGVPPDEYNVTYSIEGVQFWRSDHDIETKTEIAVPPENNVEIRRLTIVNHNNSRRLLQLTSYAEVVLAPYSADLAHPAFQKLFVESEFVPEHGILLFKRRPRASDEKELWAFHAMCAEGVTHQEYETDRTRFIGRGRTAAKPRALEERLSNTTGAVLDPIMSLRGRFRISSGKAQRISFITGMTKSRAEALRLAQVYADARNIDRAFDLARAHSRVVLQHLHITPGEALLFQRLASRILYTEHALRPSLDVVAQNTRGQNGLWTYGISGDYPIVLLRLKSGQDLEIVRQLLLAHEYWRLNNFKTDLVILDEEPVSYSEGLAVTVENMVRTSLSHPHLDKPGGVFIRRAELLAPEDKILLQTVARVTLNAEYGALDEQLKLTKPREIQVAPPPPNDLPFAPAPAVRSHELKQYDNGIGGFTGDGHEYVITLNDGQWTPLPWSNVLANPQGGALTTESGLGYSWSLNSQQNKLTPWSNDPLTDSSGQIIYLRDEYTHQVWTPTPLPIREHELYTIRHGAGYTQYEHTSHQLAQTLTVFVPNQDSVVLARLTLHNQSRHTRRISATLYAEWVLDITRDQAQQFILTALDKETNALFARNTYNADFHQRIAFAAINQPIHSFTADRAEFLGRNGTLDRPAALFQRMQLSGTVGTDLDPCAALQTTMELEPNAQKEILFLLGQGRDAADARRIIQQYRDSKTSTAAFDAARERWNNLLGTIQVKTPDAALNILLNRWLLYQCLACRMWGRSAFYQSSGAYGFRDQLQDSMALVYAAPDLAREHILRAASRQFVEGDVQHWWHPPSGKGVRTRISDDPLWLPFVVQHYLTTTGDTKILDAQIPFLVAPLLTPEQHESYGEPEISQDTASLYEHCLRALDYSLKFGEHGLPLMGTGDWNDGMNAVGAQGKGESVWLGWFLYTNLTRFADLCAQRNDAEHAEKYRTQSQTLQTALQEHAWDGAWYRRAYFDDGTPLGSAQNQECKIDAIAQAWAILSDAAPADHRRAALQAVEQNLVREQDRMILLLTPPFDHSQPSPGYIQGYVPGIRENGGQYTHGVLWVVWAFLKQGMADRAYQLFKLLYPIDHARTPGDVARYQLEPYVIAADVYSYPMHLARGGWSWYTGSAAWMYRLGLEGLLGFQLRGDAFTLDPCIPSAWDGFEITYRDGATTYQITVENPSGTNQGVKAIYLDDTPRPDKLIPRAHDNQTHHVRIELGK